MIPRRGVNKAEYMARFPRSQGKIPGLEGPNIKLTETLSIAMVSTHLTAFLRRLLVILAILTICYVRDQYLASIHGKAKLLGDGSPEQTAEIISWASWANQEFLPTAAQWCVSSVPFFSPKVYSGLTSHKQQNSYDKQVPAIDPLSHRPGAL